MNANEQRIVDLVSAERICSLALELAAVPSPTGQSREVAHLFARRLAETGAQVEVSYEFPDSPSVIGRLPGTGGGKTLQLAGHLDTIPVPHDPPYVREGIIYGRGTADMKGALAALVETVRVIHEAGVGSAGDLLLTAYGLHEAPVGRGEGLSALIARGVKGDAAIVAEVGRRALPIAGKGMGIFTFTIRRAGQSTHELSAEPQAANPLYFAGRLLAALEERAAALAAVPLPWVGPESIFVGVVSGGDFYNRVPVSAQVVGTRRHGPGQRFADVERELQAMARRIAAQAAPSALSVTVELMPVRESFALSPDEPIVQIVRGAYEDVAGAPLPLTGASTVADASTIISEAHIPAVYHGPWTERAHADVEFIALDELVQAARVYALSALRYCSL